VGVHVYTRALNKPNKQRNFQDENVTCVDRPRVFIRPSAYSDLLGGCGSAASSSSVARPDPGTLARAAPSPPRAWPLHAPAHATAAGSPIIKPDGTAIAAASAPTRTETSSPSSTVVTKFEEVQQGRMHTRNQRRQRGIHKQSDAFIHIRLLLPQTTARRQRLRRRGGVHTAAPAAGAGGRPAAQWRPFWTTVTVPPGRKGVVSTLVMRVQERESRSRILMSATAVSGQ
jgi:hypothetical protein